MPESSAGCSEQPNAPTPVARTDDRAGPHPAAADDVVDRSVLGSLLARLGDRGPAVLARLLQTWETESARRLEDLRAAAASDDTPAAAAAAHGIRGGSASLGAVALAAVCSRVEEAVRRGEAVDLEQAHAEVSAAVQEARAGLAQLRVGSCG